MAELRTFSITCGLAILLNIVQASYFDYVVDKYGYTDVCSKPDDDQLPQNVGDPDNKRCGPYIEYQWVRIRSKPKSHDKRCWYSSCSKLVPVHASCTGDCKKQSYYRKKRYVCRDKGRPEDKQNRAWVKCDMICENSGHHYDHHGEVYIKPKNTNIYYQTVYCECTSPSAPVYEPVDNYNPDDDIPTDQEKCENDYCEPSRSCKNDRSRISMRQLSALKLQCRKNFFDGANGTVNVPDVVRMSFHDCVGEEGCNGCIDTDIKANGGLDVIINKLVPFYNMMVAEMGIDPADFTLADWFALCGVAAAEKGFRNGGAFNFAKFKFKVGRPVKPSCIGDTVLDWPDSEGDFASTFAFLSNQFGYTQEQGVLAMGAHSLGAAHFENSGHLGPWTKSQPTLNNEYYKILDEADVTGWHQIAIHHPTIDLHQWEKINPDNDSKIMMLNVDMALIKDMEVDGHGDHGVCECTEDISKCTYSATRAQVTELAADNGKFVREFAEVWTIMLHKVPQGVVLKYPYDYVEDDEN